MSEQRDVGYINMPHVKEFYQVAVHPHATSPNRNDAPVASSDLLTLTHSSLNQMRYTTNPAQNWPSTPANFREVALEYHDLMLQITKGK